MIRVLDFETTGFPEDEGGADICEIGWCDVDLGAGVVHEPQSLICCPSRPVSIPARATHHLTDAQLAAGEPPQAVLIYALGDGSGYDYVAAHKADFEAAFCEPPKPWICTWKVALRVWPDAEQWNNQYLRYYLGLELETDLAMPPHRAGPDAYVTGHILLKAYQTGRASIEDMARWSTGPGLLPRVNFGKHNGSKWEDVPKDYLCWIVDKSDMDRDIKANAKYHLKKRLAAVA